MIIGYRYFKQTNRCLWLTSFICPIACYYGLRVRWASVLYCKGRALLGPKRPKMPGMNNMEHVRMFAGYIRRNCWRFLHGWYCHWWRANYGRKLCRWERKLVLHEIHGCIHVTLTINCAWKNWKNIRNGICLQTQGKQANLY